MKLAILVSFLGVSARAYCPPCGTFLTQLKPWANVPPPAPNAPVTACGCGGGSVTSRDEIQKMSSPEQREKIGKLEKETKALQEQVDSLKEKNGEALDKLKAKLKKVSEKEEKQRKDLEDGQKKRNDERREAKDEIDDKQDEMETVGTDIAEHRATLKELQSELTIRLMDMENCGCEKAKFLLAQTTKFASLLASHSFSKDDPPLYFKIEELEEKRNTLNEELMDETGSFGMEQRNLLHRIDMVEAKMNRQEITGDTYEHTDTQLAKGTKQQGKAMNKYLENKKAQLERIEKDVKAAQDKYDDLEKEMGKCGCGPKAL